MEKRGRAKTKTKHLLKTKHRFISRLQPVPGRARPRRLLPLMSFPISSRGKGALPPSPSLRPRPARSAHPSPSPFAFRSLPGRAQRRQRQDRLPRPPVPNPAEGAAERRTRRSGDREAGPPGASPSGSEGARSSRARAAATGTGPSAQPRPVQQRQPGRVRRSQLQVSGEPRGSPRRPRAARLDRRPLARAPAAAGAGSGERLPGVLAGGGGGAASKTDLLRRTPAEAHPGGAGSGSPRAVGEWEESGFGRGVRASGPCARFQLGTVPGLRVPETCLGRCVRGCERSERKGGARASRARFPGLSRLAPGLVSCGFSAGSCGYGRGCCAQPGGPLESLPEQRRSLSCPPAQDRP